MINKIIHLFTRRSGAKLSLSSFFLFLFLLYFLSLLCAEGNNNCIVFHHKLKESTGWRKLERKVGIEVDGTWLVFAVGGKGGNRLRGEESGEKDA